MHLLLLLLLWIYIHIQINNKNLSLFLFSLQLFFFLLQSSSSIACSFPPNLTSISHSSLWTGKRNNIYYDKSVRENGALVKLNIYCWVSRGIFIWSENYHKFYIISFFKTFCSFFDYHFLPIFFIREIQHNRFICCEMDFWFNSKWLVFD